MSVKRRRRKFHNKQRRHWAIVLVLVGIFMTIVLTAVSGFVFIAATTYDVPQIKQSSAQLKKAETSKIFDAGGNLITDLYVDQNRTNVTIERISPFIQKAVIATEDQRFYKHKGVDWKAIGRALLMDVRQGRIVEGGSTITQQYVKNTFITPEKTIQRKAREAALAYQVEQLYTKKEILTGYLNTVYFGQSAYGVETASHTFFNKSAADLNLPEAALLAGVIRSPNGYSPYLNPDNAKIRRDLVISLMLKQKKITPAEAQQAVATPLQVQPIKEQSIKYPYFVDYVKQLILEDKTFGSTVTERANLLYRGGLRIHTTIDPNMQAIAEDSAWNTLNKPNDPAASLVSIDPKTGYIKAMVGGRDYATQKFNLAVQSLRQPGSSFKPFVLAAAIEKGVSVNKSYQSSGGIFKTDSGPWSVDNNEGRGGGEIPLRQATAFSVNGVFARLILEIGPERVVTTAHKMGIVSFIDPFPAIALGGFSKGVSPLEMASAYGTFANDGLHAKPIAIMKVTDADDKLLLENKSTADPAIDPVTAFLVSDILQDVINIGTARSASIGRPAAGKTGTSEKNSDAWFVGYTPNLVTSVWVGYPQNRTPMTNVHGITVFGGTFPAQIWQKYMSRALRDTPASSFQRPKGGLNYVKVCTTDGVNMIANEFCPKEEVVNMLFAKGTPTHLKPCDRHKAPPGVKVANVVGQSEGSAKSILTAQGFNVVVNMAPSNGVPLGQVISQQPTEGSEAPQGSTVTIEVSSGASTSKKVVVPNVVGLPEAQAQSIISGLKLVSQTAYINPGDPGLNGKVISQDPAPGAETNEGKTVTIRVGKM